MSRAASLPPRGRRLRRLLLLLSALGLLLPALATAATWSSIPGLVRDEGWQVIGHRNHKASGVDVELRLKKVGGISCLEGTARVAGPGPEELLAVAADIAGAARWSSAPLRAARVLARRGSEMDYYQHLDVPDWTMAHDRYWVLTSRTVREPDGTVRFQWDRFDWRNRYPELAAEIDRDHAASVEPPTNYGEWRFIPLPGGQTEIRYAVCSDTGGNLPKTLQRAAALRTLPDNIGDLVKEARRRRG